MSTDFIPRKDAEFDAWATNIGAIVAEKVFGEKGEWNHIPTAAAERLIGFINAWHKAYLATLKPHTPVETEAKRDAHEDLVKDIRPFKRRYLDDPPVTDEERKAMGFPTRDRTHTLNKKPDGIPQATVDSSKIRQIGIYFKDKGAQSKAKPHGVHGAEIRWNIQDKPPVHIETELFHSEFDTASPFALTFDEADRGKRVYFALRWENTTTLKGDWSEIYSAIVP
jgi:hypothetical protein